MDQEPRPSTRTGHVRLVVYYPSWHGPGYTTLGTPLLHASVYGYTGARSEDGYEKGRGAHKEGLNWSKPSQDENIDLDRR